MAMTHRALIGLALAGSACGGSVDPPIVPPGVTYVERAEIPESVWIDGVEHAARVRVRVPMDAAPSPILQVLAYNIAPDGRVEVLDGGEGVLASNLASAGVGAGTTDSAGWHLTDLASGHDQITDVAVLLTPDGSVAGTFGYGGRSWELNGAYAGACVAGGSTVTDPTIVRLVLTPPAGGVIDTGVDFACASGRIQLPES